MTRRSALSRFLVVVLLLSVSAGVFARKKEPLRLLRFPFSLFPGMSQPDVKAMLNSKGLKLSSTGVRSGSEEMLHWSLSHQITYGDFDPQSMVTTFEEGKLASVAFIHANLSGCGAAQPVFASAMAFTQNNYDPKDAPITQEPPTEIIDCGPHFDPTAYEMHRESKKFVLVATLKVLPQQRLAVGVTYFDRAHFKPLGAEETPADSPDNPKNKTTQDNL